MCIHVRAGEWLQPGLSRQRTSAKQHPKYTTASEINSLNMYTKGM